MRADREIVREVTEEDMKAATLAFNEDDFDNMNIFANRIMANAVFGKKKDLFLPGFFLKDVAFVFGSLKASKEASAFSTAKSLCSSYLKKVSQTVSAKKLNAEKLWQQYHAFCLDLRKFQMNEFEKESYSPNYEFTKASFQWLAEYLRKNKELLLNPRNRLLKGLLNEMERIFRVHGGDINNLFSISLIRALDRYYGYLKIAYSTSEGFLDKRRAEKELFPYIEEIEGMVSTSQFSISKLDDILWKLTKRWREFFIEYLELGRPRVAVEKGIQIPEETKEKLVKSMTETLEKEVRVGKE